jgi:maltose O-acetyltransferase
MPTDKQKMLNGDLYNASDPALAEERKIARLLCTKFNYTTGGEKDLRMQILKELIPHQGAALTIEPPFFCDYGTNICVGNKVYFNYNCTVLDVTKITIGSNVLFGPSVQIYAATHPMNWKERASGLESGKPVIIGSDVWIGGGAIICPGVTIGNRCVIGAGSVVTRDVPDDCFAAGNPCRKIKDL